MKESASAPPHGTIVVVGVGVVGTRVVARLPEEWKLLLIDYDVVRQANVTRQYPQEYLDMSKVHAARDAFHPNADVLHKHLDLTTIELLRDAALVIDCTDNLIARRVINDYCSREAIPWIHTALSDTVGTVAAFVPGSACFSCIYPKGIGETCTDALELSLADKVADTAVMEARRLLAGETQATRFIRVLPGQRVTMQVEQRKDCPACSGEYRYLQPANFYITYCTSSHCMAAKPLRLLHHDHGEPQEYVVDGMPVSVFPNGEIHFHKEADDDALIEIAEKIFGSNTGSHA